jgi:hypothetical protein
LTFALVEGIMYITVRAKGKRNGIHAELFGCDLSAWYARSCDFLLVNQRRMEKVLMNKYCVAGTSQGPDGQVKIRFANDYVDRFKQLLRKGHECVNLIELGTNLTKAECCVALLDHPQFQSVQDQIAITEYMKRNRKSIEEDHFAHKAVEAAIRHSRERMGV